MTLSGKSTSQSGRQGHWRLRELTIALMAVVALDCTSWVRRAEPPADRAGPRENELHALAIAPDVDFAAAIDLGGGRRLPHSDRDLFYVEGDQFYPIVVRGYPRLTGVAPGGQAVAFLEPSEFEMAANLYVFEFPARTLRRLTDHDDKTSTRSVKAAHWLDDRTIFYLEGYRYGTVSHGGDLWRVDLASMSHKPVVQLIGDEDTFEEIVAFEFVPGHKLIRYVVARSNRYGKEVRSVRYCTIEGKPVE